MKKRIYIWDEIRGIYTVAKRRKTTFIVRIILIAIVLTVAVLNFLNRSFENFMVCLYALLLFILPPFIEKSFGISLPMTLEIVILLFIFAAEILGEIGGAYLAVPGWDVMLHGVNGFNCAAIGFALLDMFNRNRTFKFELPPLFLAVVAFCFSMTIGTIWEFIEFSSDIIFHTDMQKDTWLRVISSVDLNSAATSAGTALKISGIEETWVKLADGTEILLNPKGRPGYLDIGLFDTMKDLFVNFVGAVVFSVIGYFYVKNRNLKFAEHFIPVVKSKDEMDKVNENIKAKLKKEDEIRRERRQGKIEAAKGKSGGNISDSAAAGKTADTQTEEQQCDDAAEVTDVAEKTENK